MRVYRDADVVGRRAILEAENHFGDELRDIRSHEVGTEQLVGLGVGDELHEARALAHGARATVSTEWKLADAVFDSALLHLSFREAHRGHLWPGVDHVWNRLVVHVHVLSGYGLGSDDGFFLDLVPQA